MFVILVAMEKEAKHINCPNAKVIVTGIGVNNVINTLSRAIANGEIKLTDRIINVGYAGSTKYDLGQIISVNKSKRYKPSVTVNEGYHKLQVCYIDKVDDCITADDFVESADDVIPIADMELFYICAFGFKDIMAFKIVSDNLNYKNYESFNPTEAWERMNYILKEVTNE